ncbi:ATP phosphoribosyltransferase [Oscillochloris trichoides DG-6]|uniref:ATP phosphoribosyltransferase n=1 Tax=Oscillochloris trichoides DG-6 TaxID=765420 RepID=E1IC28_9CHLR|nr:ATP phosphoribosyltransferase [Oscillochloris trichoides]EFO81290.1 ATP phosphoribosyltransferase [Oscillochloris trichoides DG-6]
MLRFGIPSKGGGYDATLALLESCGLRVTRANPRQYTATLRGLPDTEVLLHRPADIVEKVASGNIDIGVSGLDLIHEQRSDDADLLVIFDDLGFWRVELVFAVPQGWVDVDSWADLADLAVEMKARGQRLRIATKYVDTVRNFCYRQGINDFELVESHGATEAAPSLGYADIIADITETGTAIRENKLKIVGGPLLRSHAALIGSRRSLRGDQAKLALVRQLLELIEARRRGRLFYSLTANVPGESVEVVGRKVTAKQELAGLQGPTISSVWSKFSTEESATSPWYAVNVVVPQEELLPAIDHLRSIGAFSITTLQVQHVFRSQSEAFERLLAALA